MHTGDDINDIAVRSWRRSPICTRSAAIARPTGRHGDIFTGNDDLGIASLVYKWAPGGNPTVQNLVLSGEFFYGRENGTFNGVPVDQTATAGTSQGVYQFMPRWSVGLRYAQL